MNNVSLHIFEKIKPLLWILSFSVILLPYLSWKNFFHPFLSLASGLVQPVQSYYLPLWFLHQLIYYLFYSPPLIPCNEVACSSQTTWSKSSLGIWMLPWTSRQSCLHSYAYFILHNSAESEASLHSTTLLKILSAPNLLDLLLLDGFFCWGIHNFIDPIAFVVLRLRLWMYELPVVPVFLPSNYKLSTSVS